jgi:hypothetical protein
MVHARLSLIVDDDSQVSYVSEREGERERNRDRVISSGLVKQLKVEWWWRLCTIQSRFSFEHPNFDSSQGSTNPRLEKDVERKARPV